jgi:predicted enzyme related to lactoylglutathione lyase
MTIQARYVHTNLIAKDWRMLAAFYTQVFGCVLVPPERDYQNAQLDALTGLRNAHLRGAHLRLPGWGKDDDSGPTLEIFNYAELAERETKAIHQPGFGHIAFAVDDVAAARETVLARGGAVVGEVVVLTTATGARLTVCYVTDPEGNAIELQRWERPPE